MRGFRFTQYVGELAYKHLDRPQQDRVTLALPAEVLSVVGRASDEVLLASPSGSSQALIGTREAQLQTTFFGGWEAANRWDERRTYFEKKVGELTRELDEAGAGLLMLGMVLVGHLSVNREDGEDVKKALSSLIPSTSLPDSNKAVFDFQIRASQVFSEDGFFNSYISWFESRSFNVPQPGARTITTTLKTFHWEGILEDQGIEIRFDFNNKHGLFLSKRSWSADSLLDLISEGFDLAEEVYPRLCALLDEKLPARYRSTDV